MGRGRAAGARGCSQSTGRETTTSEKRRNKQDAKHTYLTSGLIEQQLKLVDTLAFQQVSSVPNRTYSPLPM
jgi:hypothetical protein